MKHLLSPNESILFWKQIYQEDLSEEEQIAWNTFKNNNPNLDEYSILDNELIMHHKFEQSREKYELIFLERLRLDLQTRSHNPN